MDDPATGAAEAERRRNLQRMRRRATGLLAVAAIVFVAARAAEDGGAAWIGYVRAAAEAAMVGGVADWFAVTALFRRPLGLPIPHTAIVPTRKDQLGVSLGAFVTEHFLDPDQLGERVAAAAPAQRLADWLAVPGHRDAVADQAAVGLAGALGLLGDERVEQAVAAAVLDRLGTLDVATLAGRIVSASLDEQRHAPLVDAVLDAVVATVTAQKAAFRVAFDRESPRWVPGRIDDRVFERIFAGVVHALEDLRSDRAHPVRRHLDDELATLAGRLRDDHTLRARLDAWRDDLIAHPAVGTWASSLWGDLRTAVRRQADDPASPLRTGIAAAVAAAADALARDPDLRARVDGWIVAAATGLARRERPVVGRFIATTVERWDATDTAARVELAVGRDLQFIRINGTVVGGLVGVAIHAVGQLL
jgi:uncharacterized membrane-anchored protein YjiN (DUF445 family)